MRQINKIIIHCAATKGDVSAPTVRKWHKAKGWRDIGYHYVIRTNGTIETGRKLSETGAHTKGHNKDSIGICIAGGFDGTTDGYTDEQWTSLDVLVRGLAGRFEIPAASILGHNNFTNAKTCPNFDVGDWVSRIYMKGHLAALVNEFGRDE